MKCPKIWTTIKKKVFINVLCETKGIFFFFFFFSRTDADFLPLACIFLLSSLLKDGIFSYRSYSLTLQNILSSFQEGLLLLTFKAEAKLPKNYFKPFTSRIHTGLYYGKLCVLHIHHSSLVALHSIPLLLQKSRKSIVIREF